MAQVTLSQAKRMLKSTAPGIAEESKTVAEMAERIAEELRLYRKGENPLSDRQVKAFYDFGMILLKEGGR